MVLLKYLSVLIVLPYILYCKSLEDGKFFNIMDFFVKYEVNK